jgi:hypothetical protein
MKAGEILSRNCERRADIAAAFSAARSSDQLLCDKRYLLVLMFVDYAVEPFYYERRIDFCENGQN